MAKVFVFAKEVQQRIDEGRGEIELPEGARISAAALDLIRAHQIKVTYTRVQRAAESEQAPQPQADAEAAAEKQTAAVAAASAEEGKPAAGLAVSGEVSAADLDAIVERVIGRLREMKKQPAAAPRETGLEPQEGDDLVICRCEEITRGEIKEAIRQGMRTLNGIKRVTRAGMGLCQGQTCERLVSQILAAELGVPPAEVAPTTSRAPVRPARLSVFATG